jgi:hypothetical protein
MSKSILEYDDVISSLRYVEERVRKETAERVMKETTERVEKETTEKVRKEDRIEFVRNCHKCNVGIEQIVAFTALTEKEVSDIIAKL